MKNYRIVWDKYYEAYVIQKRILFIWWTLNSSSGSYKHVSFIFTDDYASAIKFDTVENADEFLDEYEKFKKTPTKTLAKTIKVIE